MVEEERVRIRYSKEKARIRALAREMRLRRIRRTMEDGRFVNRPYGTVMGRIAAGLRPSQ